MPIRNPFARRPGGAPDENVRPGSAGIDTAAAAAQQQQAPHFERVDTIGSMASSSLSVQSRKSQDTGEYKMSVVNDSGVYLPPSPTERDANWSRRYLSRTSTDTRSSGVGVGDIEPFSISRESFDSYRRSFDISARSAIVDLAPARQSLDSARLGGAANGRPPPRTAHGRLRYFEHAPPPTAEESAFEDVGLNDDAANNNNNNTRAHSRKRGFFAKFGVDHSDSNNTSTSTSGGQSTSTPVSRFLMPGRKRAQSGQGAELAAIDSRPTTANKEAQEVQG